MKRIVVLTLCGLIMTISRQHMAYSKLYCPYTPSTVKEQETAEPDRLEPHIFGYKRQKSASKVEQTRRQKELSGRLERQKARAMREKMKTTLQKEHECKKQELIMQREQMKKERDRMAFERERMRLARLREQEQKRLTPAQELAAKEKRRIASMKELAKPQQAMSLAKEEEGDEKGAMQVQPMNKKMKSYKLNPADQEAMMVAHCYQKPTIAQEDISIAGAPHAARPSSYLYRDLSLKKANSKVIAWSAKESYQNKKPTIYTCRSQTTPTQSDNAFDQPNAVVSYT